MQTTETDSYSDSLQMEMVIQYQLLHKFKTKFGNAARRIFD